MAKNDSQPAAPALVCPHCGEGIEIPPHAAAELVDVECPTCRQRETWTRLELEQHGVCRHQAAPCTFCSPEQAALLHPPVPQATP
jgi:hypothetical protein